MEKNFVDVKLPPDLPEEKMDNRILKVCLGLKRSAAEELSEQSGWSGGEKVRSR